MIWESGYWKEDLLRQASALRKRTNQRRWQDRSLARLEQNVMLGFYSIRKLLEAKKLTIDIIERAIPVVAYHWKGENVNLLNWHKIDQLYYLDQGNNQTQSAQWLCNLVVHSYVFSPTFGEDNELNGLLVNSDRTRHKALYFIQLEHIIALFVAVGSDAGNYAEVFQFDPDTGDFKVILRNSPKNEEGP